MTTKVRYRFVVGGAAVGGAAVTFPCIPECRAGEVAGLHEWSCRLIGAQSIITAAWRVPLCMPVQVGLSRLLSLHDIVQREVLVGNELAES